MLLSSLLSKKSFVVTAELGPPKGTSMEKFFQQAHFLKGCVDAVNVTDGQSAMMRLSSIAASHLLKDFGIEPIAQMTCRDRNRLALQSDLLSASVLGVQNVLVLTGDPIHIGDHPEAKAVFDLDASTLMSTIKKIRSGLDMTDHKLEGSCPFSIGAAMNPCVDDVETEISKTRKKIESGADFFQTQGIFDADRFIRFIERYKKEGFRVPILGGIILIKSAKQAQFMNEKIPGIVIPKSVIDQFSSASDSKALSIATAVDTIQAIRPYCQGVHLMAIGWEELVPEIIKRIS